MEYNPIGGIIYPSKYRSGVRLDRGAWRILLHRNRQYAGVTTLDGATKPSGPPRDYEILSCGVGVDIMCNRRVETDILIAETGSGPDGSSLTANY